jgi:hypothetical protein
MTIAALCLKVENKVHHYLKAQGFLSLMIRKMGF